MPRLTGIHTSPSTSDELASNAYVSAASGGLSSGTIIMYVSDLMPGGFLLCNGNAVSRSTYSSLFSAIGTTYGGSLGANGGSFDHVHSMGAHTHAQSHTHTIAHTHTISHSHTIDHAHAVGTHVHNAAHTHTIQPHYHNVSGTANFANHTHTSAISS